MNVAILLTCGMTPSEEWDFPVGLVMLAFHILIFTICMRFMFVCTCDHGYKSSG
jgi:hypothetical protein